MMMEAVRLWRFAVSDLLQRTTGFVVPASKARRAGRRNAPETIAGMLLRELVWDSRHWV
jgi:hypothetical protein